MNIRFAEYVTEEGLLVAKLLQRAGLFNISKKQLINKKIMEVVSDER